MQKIRWWNWLFYFLFRRKELILPPATQEIDFDKILVDSINEKKKLEQRQKEELERREQEKAETLAKRRNEILSPLYFEKGIKALAKMIDENHSGIISKSACGLVDYEEWDIFKEQFVLLLKNKGIKISDAMIRHPEHIWVEPESVRAYYEKCKKEDKPKHDTITTGPYR